MRTAHLQKEPQNHVPITLKILSAKEKYEMQK